MFGERVQLIGRGDFFTGVRFILSVEYRDGPEIAARKGKTSTFASMVQLQELQGTTTDDRTVSIKRRKRDRTALIDIYETTRL